MHTSGEDIEGDLTTDGVGQAEMGEFLLEDLNELGSDTVFLKGEQMHISKWRWVRSNEAYQVVFLVGVSLLVAVISGMLSNRERGKI